ncbi:MAG: Dabb family protein [Thermodesulfobacteriota bacterium]
MIKHIVMWKLIDLYEGLGKQQIEKKLKNDLESLKSKIPQIKAIEAGINFNASEASYDLVLYSEFESKEDLSIYQKHPEHLKVAEFVSGVRTERCVVDYEI